MSVTIFANLDNDQIKMKSVRCVDLYELENEYFQGDGYAMGSDGFYVTEIPDMDGRLEANFANANFRAIMRLIDPNMAIVSADNGLCGDVKAEDVAAFNAKVLRALNSSRLPKHTRETVRDGNMIVCGIDSEYLERALTAISEVCQTAVKFNKPICWG